MATQRNSELYTPLGVQRSTTQMWNKCEQLMATQRNSAATQRNSAATQRNSSALKHTRELQLSCAELQLSCRLQLSCNSEQLSGVSEATRPQGVVGSREQGAASKEQRT